VTSEGNEAKSKMKHPSDMTTPRFEHRWQWSSNTVPLDHVGTHTKPHKRSECRHYKLYCYSERKYLLYRPIQPCSVAPDLQDDCWHLSSVTTLHWGLKPRLQEKHSYMILCNKLVTRSKMSRQLKVLHGTTFN